MLRNWYWLVIAIAVCLFGARMYLRYAVPVYSISKKIIIESNPGQGRVSEEIIAQELGFQQSYTLLNEMEILKSRSLMLQVVDSLQIHITYISEGRLKNTEIYWKENAIQLTDVQPAEKASGLNFRIRTIDNNRFTLLKSETDTAVIDFGQPFQWQGRTVTLDLGIENRNILPGGVQAIRVNNPDPVAGMYAGRLGISQVRGRSDVLNLSLFDPTPDKAADILNTLVEIYNRNVIEERNEVGRKTLDFIDERLRFITEELYEVEDQVESFRQDNDLPVSISNKAQRYLNEVEGYDRAIADLEIRQSLLDEIDDFFRRDTAFLEPLPITSEVLPGALTSLINDYNEIILDRQRVLQSATPDNPAAQLSVNQSENLRRSILLTVSTVKRENSRRLDDLRDRLRPLEGQSSMFPTTERQLLQIMRQQRIKESLFLFLLQTREETSLSIAAQVGNTRIIDDASIGGPISPRSSQTYVFAILLGLVIPTTIIFLIELFDDKIYSEKDIRKLTSTPFLGGIPQSGTDKNIVVSKGSRSGVAEAFRLMRTNLQFLLAGIDKPVILVTSAVSGEGKSFITLNLGMTLALADKRVCLIGMDLRKPKLSRYLDAPVGLPGVSNVLIGESSPSEVVHQSEANDNLFYISSGPTPPNPAELILGSSTNQLFAYLREHFDVVLVDTAPLGLVTDALLLQEHVDAALFVSHFGKSKRQSLQLIDNIYREKKLERPAIILNGIKASGGYGYHYYGYSYGYGYGYGYYSEEKKHPKWQFWRK